MSKTIVKIDSDEKVKLIKVFRTINKEAGTANKENDSNKFMQLCTLLKQLAEKAETKGFHIWVNENGKTGHTYEKDYKDTPDIDNDYDAYIIVKTEKLKQHAQQMLMSLLFNSNGRQAN
jgi:hypothetical protein